MAGFTRRLVACGACGKKGAYLLQNRDFYTVRCRYCKRERGGYLSAGATLEKEAGLLGLIDTPGDRVAVY